VSEDTTAMPTKAQLKRTLRGLQERLAAHPMDLDARMRVARTYRLLEQKKDAIAHYRTVARYLSLAGRPLQAVAVLKELLQIAPKHEETLLFLAKLYARTRAADATNTGRVAVPILDDNASAMALPGGMPLTSTGIWRAIRPEATDLYAVVKDSDDAGAVVRPSDIDAELHKYSDEGDEDEDALEVSDQFILEAMSQEGDAEDADDEIDEDDATQEEPPVRELDDQVLLEVLNEKQLVLPRVPLLSSLPVSAFVELSHSMEFRRKAPGEYIFEEGEKADSLLVIIRGDVHVVRKPTESQPERELSRLGEGELIGLFALMMHEVRTASVRAATDVEYFEVHRDALDALVERFPEVKESLAQLFRERLLLNILCALPFFSELPSSQREDMAKRFIDKKYDKGDDLFVQGTDIDGLWVILEGEARVERETTMPGISTKALLHPGDFVGSLAGSREEDTQLGATALTSVRAALFPQRELRQLARDNKRFAAFSAVLDEEGLLLSPNVYAGNGRIPGRLTELRKVFG